VYFTAPAKAPAQAKNDDSGGYCKMTVFKLRLSAAEISLRVQYSVGTVREASNHQHTKTTMSRQVINSDYCN
jgi:hypothetical protein